MTARPNPKLRILYLMEYLRQETDEERSVSMAAILTHLAERGLTAERKTIYDDIGVLREFGMDIEVRPGKPPTYGLGSRAFETPEVALLIDAVLSSRFLTTRKSRTLVGKLSQLVSRRQAQELDKQIYVAGRIKMQNESVYYNIDAIHRALIKGRKISFKYFEYNLKKQHVLKRDGQAYFVSPVGLAYVDGFYYLVTYGKKFDRLSHYRVDRMKGITVQDDPAEQVPAEFNFDMADHVGRFLGMFQGEAVKVELEIDAWTINSIIDRFGKDIEIIQTSDDKARVFVDATDTSLFFGWLVGLGTGVRIVSPTKLAQEYKEHLQSIASLY